MIRAPLPRPLRPIKSSNARAASAASAHAVTRCDPPALCLGDAGAIGVTQPSRGRSHSCAAAGFAGTRRAGCATGGEVESACLEPPSSAGCTPSSAVSTTLARPVAGWAGTCCDVAEFSGGSPARTGSGRSGASDDGRTMRGGEGCSAGGASCTGDATGAGAGPGDGAGGSTGVGGIWVGGKNSSGSRYPCGSSTRRTPR
jgi:hypothetical protein